MNYQGYLTDSLGNPINGAVSMTFSIWTDSSSGSQLWTETQNVTVDSGLFNVILGTDSLIQYSIFEPGASRWLQLQVSGQTLSPRNEITSVGFAYKAIKSDSADFVAGSVSNADMVDSIHASTALTPNCLYPLDIYGTLRMEKDSDRAIIRVWNTGTSGNDGAIVGGTSQPSGTGIIGWGERCGVGGGTNQIVYPAGRVGVAGWGETCGGYFRTDVSGGYGCWGYSSGGAYGVYYTGGIGGTGKNNLVVESSKGPVALSVQASPESWFEDFGSSKLIHGKVRIELCPLFLETVEISDTHPMKVYIQLTDECNGVYVRKHATGFEVIELDDGSSNASIDYRVVAKRKNFENDRFEIVPTSYEDAYLYLEKKGNVTVRTYGE
jgi:hypothetical protein